MPTFILDRETSLECTLFEGFAKFLTKLKYPKVRKIEAEKFRQYVAELLALEGQGGPLSPETVKGYFIETEPHAEIEIDRFKAFCVRFVTIFGRLEPDQKRDYAKINFEFVRWRNGIYQKHQWELNVSSNDEKLNNVKSYHVDH